MILGWGPWVRGSCPELGTTGMAPWGRQSGLVWAWCWVPDEGWYSLHFPSLHREGFCGLPGVGRGVTGEYCAIAFPTVFNASFLTSVLHPGVLILQLKFLALIKLFL